VTEVEVKTLTIARARVGTRLVAYRSLWMSASRVMVQRTFRTSFVQGIYVTGSRTVTKNKIAPNVNTVMRGTMIIMALTTTRPTDVVLWLEDVMKWGSSLSLTI
jgi:hypothetical protein